MEPSIIIPPTASKDPQTNDYVTPCHTNVTDKKSPCVTVTLTMGVEYFRSNQGRPILTLDYQQHFEVTPAAARQQLSRLVKAGPVRRTDPGIYQYDPTKEQGNLRSVLQSGNWKFENLVFVTKGTRSLVLSRSEPSSAPEKDPDCDMQKTPIPIPGPGCIPHPEWPGMDLPTGQLVRWWNYPTTGTEMICISANRAPPLDPGYLLYITEVLLRSHGFDPAKWYLTCVEYLIDSEKITFEGTHTYQAFEREVFKGYNHGYYGRFEIADRRITPSSEFIENCRILASGTLNTHAIRGVHSLKNEVGNLGKIVRLTYNIATGERDKRIERDRSMKEVQDVPGPSLFKTGAEFKRERAGEPPPE